MAERAKVSLRFADGSEITDVPQFEERQKFSDPIDTLTMSLTPTVANRQTYTTKLQRGERVTMLVNGRPQAVYYIQDRTRSVSPDGGVVFDVTAVSPIKVLMESSVDVPTASKALSGATPLIDIVLEVVEPYGFDVVTDQSDVDVIKTKTGRELIEAGESTKHKGAKKKDIQAEYNETVYTFLSRMTSRAGVMLRFGLGKRGASLYLTAPHYKQRVAYTVKQAVPGAGPRGSRFFGSVEVTETNEDQYSECQVFGETPDDKKAARANRPKGSALTTDINAGNPPFRASPFVSYKPVFYKDKNSESKQHCDTVAKHVLGKRAERAFRVSGTVQGLVSDEGTPWTVDTLCRVYIEALGIDQEMWLSERAFRRDARGADTTQLVFIPKGYLTLGEIPIEQ